MHTYLAERDLIKIAQSQGFIVERTRDQHLRFVPPDKALPLAVVAPYHHRGDIRTYKNAIKNLRRSGLVINVDSQRKDEAMSGEPVVVTDTEKSCKYCREEDRRNGDKRDGLRPFTDFSIDTHAKSGYSSSCRRHQASQEQARRAEKNKVNRDASPVVTKRLAVGSSAIVQPSEVREIILPTDDVETKDFVLQMLGEFEEKMQGKFAQEAHDAVVKALDENLEHAVDRAVQLLVVRDDVVSVHTTGETLILPADTKSLFHVAEEYAQKTQKIRTLEADVLSPGAKDAALQWTLQEMVQASSAMTGHADAGQGD